MIPCREGQGLCLDDEEQMLSVPSVANIASWQQQKTANSPWNGHLRNIPACIKMQDHFANFSMFNRSSVWITDLLDDSFRMESNTQRWRQLMASVGKSIGMSIVMHADIGHSRGQEPSPNMA
jgi:hypothetical protein